MLKYNLYCHGFINKNIIFVTAGQIHTHTRHAPTYIYFVFLKIICGNALKLISRIFLIILNACKLIIFCLILLALYVVLLSALFLDLKFFLLLLSAIFDSYNIGCLGYAYNTQIYISYKPLKAISKMNSLLTDIRTLMTDNWKAVGKHQNLALPKTDFWQEASRREPIGIPETIHCCYT